MPTLPSTVKIDRRGLGSKEERLAIQLSYRTVKVTVGITLAGGGI
jgi:hypothetical protein